MSIQLDAQKMWSHCFHSCFQSLQRNDYVYIRRFSPDWNESVGALRFARSVVRMSHWPANIPVNRTTLNARLEAFNSLRIHHLACWQSEKRIVISGWSGTTVDGKNSQKLVKSLRLHHKYKLHIETARVTLGWEFFFLLALTLLLFSSLSTVIFGVGLGYKVGRNLLEYYETFVLLQKRSHDELQVDEEILRRTLCETMELCDELNSLFAELKVLQNSFELDSQRIAEGQNGSGSPIEFRAAPFSEV